jgi:hypothetical protein
MRHPKGLQFIDQGRQQIGQDNGGKKRRQRAAKGINYNKKQYEQDKQNHGFFIGEIAMKEVANDSVDFQTHSPFSTTKQNSSAVWLFSISPSVRRTELDQITQHHIGQGLLQFEQWHGATQCARINLNSYHFFTCQLQVYGNYTLLTLYDDYSPQFKPAVSVYVKYI